MYYFDDGSKFSSKIEAIQYSLKSQKNFRLYYFDEVFSSIDWSIEPSNTLQYHYKQQAQRIRDEYDYVVLCYSGGADSTNILETYVYNNIKLDKIVVVGALSEDSSKGVDENHNGELYHNVFPYLKDLGLEGITQICDYTTLFDKPENFSIYEYGENWVDVVGTRLSPHNWFWRDLHKHVVPIEWRSKKVAIIFGKDKPKLSYHDNKFAFRFSDIVVNNYGNIETVDNCDRINFYWDPNYPLIIIKQLHILKSHFNAFKFGDSVDNMVYNLKRPLVFKSPKSRLNYLSLRDNFLVNKKNSSIYKFYFDGLHYMNKKIGMNHQTIYSKFYYINDN
jgi:hypothetical protein